LPACPYLFIWKLAAELDKPAFALLSQTLLLDLVLDSANETLCPSLSQLSIVLLKIYSFSPLRGLNLTEIAERFTQTSL
jgi:hypothetical protein